MQANSAAVPAQDILLPNPNAFVDRKPFGNYLSSPPSANTVLFRTNIAAIGKSKNAYALVDSGATHNFCYEEDRFINYTEMAHEVVQDPAGESKALGYGDIWIPILGGVRMRAYHVPEFNTHILAISKLDVHVDVTFSRHNRPWQ